MFSVVVRAISRAADTCLARHALLIVILRLVVEYAKITSPHLKVIACAGSQQKVDILKSVGADVAFNYKEADVNKVLAENGPIDMYVVLNIGITSLLTYFCSYWDNVAGSITDAALQNMNMFGTIIVRLSH